MRNAHKQPLLAASIPPLQQLCGAFDAAVSTRGPPRYNRELQAVTVPVTPKPLLRSSPMKTKSHYLKLRSFCWARAHKAVTAQRRTFWFDQFEVADQFSHLVA